jgi:hypothetical protein
MAMITRFRRDHAQLLVFKIEHTMEDFQIFFYKFILVFFQASWDIRCINEGFFK